MCSQKTIKNTDYNHPYSVSFVLTITYAFLNKSKNKVLCQKRGGNNLPTTKHTNRT